MRPAMNSITSKNDTDGDNIDRRIRALCAGQQGSRRAQLMHAHPAIHAILRFKTRLSNWAMLTGQAAIQSCSVQDHDHGSPVYAINQFLRSLVSEAECEGHALLAISPSADRDILRSRQTRLRHVQASGAAGGPKVSTGLTRRVRGCTSTGYQSCQEGLPSPEGAVSVSEIGRSGAARIDKNSPLPVSPS
jgi:hypothetical protein